MLYQLNDEYFDLKEVSYISNLERHINHAANSTIHYFVVIVGGQKVEVKAHDMNELNELRTKLIIKKEVFNG